MSDVKPKIIYVDDEPLNLTIGRLTLNERFEVFCFESGEAALQELTKIKPCIVLSDLKMPEMNGVEFLEKVQQILPSAQRVIITGNSDEQSAIEAIKRAEVCEFVKKPIEQGDLEAAMEKAYTKFLAQNTQQKLAKKAIRPDLMEHPSWLHLITSQLHEAFQELPQYSVTERQIEDWALLVHLSMSAEKRYYHNTQHLFDIWDVRDAYERLAILFHDVVYAQVDKNSVKGLLSQIVQVLGILVPSAELNLILPHSDLLPGLPVLYTIFGMKPGDVLNTSNGMNEFLSARVAQKVLGPVLSLWDTVQIMSCIELTIPFRPKDASGNKAPDRLLKRLIDLNRSASLGVTEEQCLKAVERAVDVTNRDLWGFAAKDPADFLNGSWKLILEGNVPLQQELHTPKDYRTALGKMEGFLQMLKPEVIFQRIGEFPNEKDYFALLEQCQKNLESGRIYFQAKILAMGLLEAIDVFTGGNGPIELLRGDVESETHPHAENVEKYLQDDLPAVAPSEMHPQVLELLCVKGESNIRYDLQNSPLAIYVYLHLTRAEFQSLLGIAQEFFKGKLQAMDLIQAFPKNLVLSILRAVAKVSKSRRAEIEQMIHSLAG